MLFSKITPPVFVAARRLTTKDMRKNNSLKSLFVPFDIKQLQEELFIKSNKAAFDNCEAVGDEADESNHDASAHSASYDKS